MPEKPKNPRRFRHKILLHVNPGSESLDAILKQVDAYGWGVLDLDLSRGKIPMDPPPIGAIVGDLPDSALVGRLRDLGVPVVRLGSMPHPQDHEMPAVLPDYAPAGHLAADHFAERQFHHVAFVGHNPWRERKVAYDAFLERAVERGCDCHLMRVDDPLMPEGVGLNPAEAEDKWERSYREIAQWLKGLPKPVGLFVYNDWMAARICGWCADLELMVPEDIAILGFGNNNYICRVSPVVLSSVQPDREGYGRQAVCLLKRLIGGEEAPAAPILIPPKDIVERQSTNVMAVPDPVVSRGLRFIWDHLDLPITVDDIAATVGVCRRTLERAFKKHLNRGVKAELQRKRLEHCCELLKTTKMTIPEITRALGLHSKDHLHETFRKTYGMTPRQFRVRGNGVGNSN